MTFNTFSKKQLSALTWWCKQSPVRDRDAIICDGAVRSGKTMCLSLSFIIWATASFDGQSFGLCGKTVKSLSRNVVTPMLEPLSELGFECDYKISRQVLTVSFSGRTNRFYLFGGKDEGSAALIQGVTLAGVFMDEVALMPRSFVEQAIARCSVDGARLWFNCNPEHPRHWFYTEWIGKREEKNVYYLHFIMDDNPSLSKKTLKRYKSLYSGAFFERYVLGKWTAANGAVYPMFSENRHVVSKVPLCSRYLISCDYGTLNPASLGLWGESDGVWYRVREYYHSGRASGVLKTDEDYADAVEKLASDLPVEAVIVDPSAASFIQCLRRRGKFTVIPAKNDVLSGIRVVSAALKSGKLRFHKSCKAIINEFSLYRWKENAAADVPVKENDHAMDDLRYFAVHVFDEREAFFAAKSIRR